MLVASIAALLCLSCTTASYVPRDSQFQGTWSEPPTGARSRFNQSCGAACGAPFSPSTGELLVPAARAGQVLEKAAQVAEILQGFITVTKFLDESQKGVVEKIIIQCVKEANTKVDNELFGKGRSLPDSECDKEAVVPEKPGTSWAQHLGDLKHAAAFACIQKRLAEKFPDNFSIEPRYRKDPFTQDVILTDWRTGSLKPDVVIHFTRNATRIQCIYELKFPCGYEVANPWTSWVETQMQKYKGLGGQCLPALVSPQRGVQLNQQDLGVQHP